MAKKVKDVSKTNYATTTPTPVNTNPLAKAPLGAFDPNVPQQSLLADQPEEQKQNVKTEFINGGVRRTNEKGDVEVMSRAEYEERYLREGPYITKLGQQGRAEDRARLISQGLVQPNEQEVLQQAQQVMQLLDQQQNVAPNQDANINIVPDLLSNVAQKAGIGAAGGAVAGGGVGALVGGIGGAAVGAVTVLPELKSEYAEAVSDQYATLVGSKKALSSLINDMNKGNIGRQQGLALYNAEILKIRQARSNLILLGEKEWLSKSKGELTKINSFLDSELPGMNQEFAKAYALPDPTRLEYQLETELE